MVYVVYGHKYTKVYMDQTCHKIYTIFIVYISSHIVTLPDYSNTYVHMSYIVRTCTWNDVFQSMYFLN